MCVCLSDMRVGVSACVVKARYSTPKSSSNQKFLLLYGINIKLVDLVIEFFKTEKLQYEINN